MNYPGRELKLGVSVVIYTGLIFLISRKVVGIKSRVLRGL
jgi:hypothetical protein